MLTKNHSGKVEIIDLRTIYPIDEELIFNTVKKHGKCLLLTEEPFQSSFYPEFSIEYSRKLF